MIKSGSQNVNSLQDQINSLATVVLQQGRTLSILTAEKGGYYAMLGEECCYFVNQSGTVKEQVQKLKKLAADIRERQYFPKATPWSPWWDSLGSWTPILMPIMGPIITIVSFLLVAPCAFRLLL